MDEAPVSEELQTLKESIVDLYLAIGEPLMPALAPLSSAQAKLLQIYIQRATQPGAAPGNAA